MYLRKSKTRPDAWWGRYFEPVIAEDGTLKRVQRNKRLGVRGRNDGQLTKRLAERELRPYVDAANNYQPTAARPQVSRKAATLFSEFAAVWLEKGLVHRKASTKYGMRCHIKAHLIPAFGRIPMGDLESERVQSFVNELAERRSPKTVKAVLTTLRVMWKSAVAWKYVEDELFVKRPKVKDVEMRCYSAEEVRRILTNAVGEDRTLLWLLAETGMRAGEVTALAANAIDLDNRVVEVRRSIWHGIMGDTKTGPRRMICISSPLAANLAEHLAGRTEGYLFRTETGEPWDSNKVRDKKLNRILERAGIPKIDEKLLATTVGNDKTIAQATRSEVRQASLGLHSFRHTNATAMDSQHIPKGGSEKAPRAQCQRHYCALYARVPTG